jgi:inward rectifier potassium channel
MADESPRASTVAASNGSSPFTDLYHYLVRSPWPVLLILIIGTFTIANALFGLAYWIDGGVHGEEAPSYADMFFFSVQTMATIGYGVMHPGTFLANVLVTIEAIMGLLGVAMTTGLVFAKFSLPSARVRFSQYAVISKRDGVPSLMFRMANLRESRIIEAQMHLVFARMETTAEGERLRRFYDLKLTRDRTALFTLSWTAVHQIIGDSPLLGETAKSLKQSAAMVVVSIVGLEETYSQTVNARKYYSADEIIWGKRLGDITIFKPDGGPVLDYSRFDDLVDAPL